MAGEAIVREEAIVRDEALEASKRSCELEPTGDSGLFTVSCLRASRRP